MKDRLRRGFASFAGFADWFITLAIAVTVATLGLTDSAGVRTIGAVTLGVLSLMCLTSIRDRLKWKRVEGKIDYLRTNVASVTDGYEILADKQRTGIDRVLGGVVDFDWLPEIRASRNVTVIKMKANFTNSPEYFSALEGVLDRGGTVTIVISDPRAPATLLRYMDEPTSLTSATPVRASARNPWVNGLEEIAADIHRLGLWYQELRREGRNLGKLELKISTHYPSHAFLKFDNRLYVYHYPFMSRGFHAPCMLFTNEKTATYKYLTECMTAVIDASDSLTTSADDIWHQCREGDFSDRTLENVSVVRSDTSVEIKRQGMRK